MLNLCKLLDFSLLILVVLCTESMSRWILSLAAHQLTRVSSSVLPQATPLRVLPLALSFWRFNWG